MLAELGVHLEDEFFLNCFLVGNEDLELDVGVHGDHAFSYLQVETHLGVCKAHAPPDGILKSALSVLQEGGVPEGVDLLEAGG